jgi:hypothetical protein
MGCGWAIGRRGFGVGMAGCFGRRGGMLPFLLFFCLSKFLPPFSWVVVAFYLSVCGLDVGEENLEVLDDRGIYPCYPLCLRLL